jgi:hypothetical protein
MRCRTVAVLAWDIFGEVGGVAGRLTPGVAA